MKPDSFLRPSAFSMLCPREEVICGRIERTRRNEVDADTMLTFAHGRALHNILQNEVLPAIGVLLGKWSCQRCGHFHEGSAEGPLLDQIILRPDKCSKCGKENEFLYHEMFFKNEEFNIGGHPDGFLKIQERSDIGLLEAKSISPNGAFEIKGTPKMDHVIQAQIYMWLTGLKWAKVFYWNKGMFGRNAITEHFIEYDHDTVSGIQETIKEIREGLVSGKLPDRICETQHCTRALECSSAEACFDLKEEVPHGYKPAD